MFFNFLATTGRESANKSKCKNFVHILENDDSVRS